MSHFFDGVHPTRGGAPISTKCINTAEVYAKHHCDVLALPAILRTATNARDKAQVSREFVIAESFSLDVRRVANRPALDAVVEGVFLRHDRDAIVEVRESDALQTLSSGLLEIVDLPLLDGAKALYPDILALVEPWLRPGAVVLADDAHCSPDYLGRVHSPAAGYLSLPFREDVELSLR